MRGWVMSALLAGCYAPAPLEGAPCGPEQACPTPQVCDPLTSRCVLELSDPADAPSDGLACPQGFVVEADACVDVDECDVAGACGADATCTNAPGSFSCACNPGFSGDGQTCARICSRVLIFDDCTAPDEDCMAIPEALFADDAAEALGMTVLYGGVSDEAAFRDLFDAAGFDVLVFESSLSSIDIATADRVASWVSGGGRAIVSFWDLDNDTTGRTIRTALEVSTVGEITTPRDVHRDPQAVPNLFDRVQSVTSPLTFRHLMVDDGDELALTGDGVLAARHTSPTGPGAIAITRDDRAITLGFVPVGLVFQGPRDADNDGKPDVQELYENLLGFVCGF